MFKAIRYEKPILIVLFWSVLAFIGYNILTAEASENEDKKVCEDYGGEWKETIRVDVDGNEKGSGDKQCQFDNDKDLQAYSVRPGYSLDGTGSDAEYGRVDLDMSDDEAAAIEDDICDNEDARVTNIRICMSDEREQEVEERKELDKEMYTSKTFKNLLESKGIDYDDYKNDKLSAEKQDELETEFREDKSDEYAEEIKTKEEQNDLPNKLSPYYNSEPALSEEEKEDFEEGKRYVNPDGGAPLYEDELTEDEKDYYEEYKPEKEEEPPVIYDWGNEVKLEDGEEQIQNELKETTPEEAEEMNEQNQLSEQEEEADEQVEEEQEEEEDEPEEEEDDNSGSESEE